MHVDCPLVQLPSGKWWCPVPGCDPKQRDLLPGKYRRNCRATSRDGKTPPLQQQAWNLATSLAAFVADGLKTVDEKQYRERMEICDGCEHRRGNRCLKCGCWLTFKVRGRAFKCPEEKWPTHGSIGGSHDHESTVVCD